MDKGKEEKRENKEQDIVFRFQRLTHKPFVGFLWPKKREDGHHFKKDVVLLVINIALK